LTIFQIIMKKQKLSLEELKVESFITKEGNIKGGTDISAISISVTVASYIASQVTSIIAGVTDGCVEYSEASDCSFSA